METGGMISRIFFPKITLGSINSSFLYLLLDRFLTIFGCNKRILSLSNLCTISVKIECRTFGHGRFGQLNI